MKRDEKKGMVVKMLDKAQKILNRSKKIYEDIVYGGAEGKEMRTLLKELIRMQKQDGFWRGINPEKCPSDARVDFVYFPTYYATAALIYAYLHSRDRWSKGASKALDKGLRAAMGRKLQGHGFGATGEMMTALAIYRTAGLYQYINCNPYHPFSRMIKEIFSDMRLALNTGKTTSDWNRNFKEEYEAELREYEEAQTKSPVANYVWYACYGSNINRTRFMRYIDMCSRSTPPREDRRFLFPYDMYFAKSTMLWDNGSKAFLDDTAEGWTYGRIYKISMLQFREICRMEGSDYTKQLYLGDLEGYPIYSFTDTQRNPVTKAPSAAYYRTILEGLRECYGEQMETKKLNEYLIGRVFSGDEFAVIKAIFQSPHSISAEAISTASGVACEAVEQAIEALCDRGLIRQKYDSLGMDAPQYYTANAPWSRELVAEMLKYETF